MYPQAVIQELKERLSIVTMIGEIVPLKKAGRNYRGLCPFHQEKTPSFHVHEEKQIFHCFGCGEGGDLIHFFMKRDGRTFREAVEYLAQRAGVELPAVGSEAAEVLQQRRRQEKLLLRVNVVAAEYFQQALMDVERPRIYLESRGYRDAGFFTQHLLGYADDRWDSLVHFFQQRRVPMELAVHVGLIKKRPQKEGHYDFFRDRLIFPIRDSHGAIVAFGGRDLGDGEADGAKYLNTAESPIFHKGEMLYGFPMAADAMRRADRALVVEGYLDVLALHRVGLEETVAPLGTALTAGHLRQIVRYTKNIWLLFDADAAGQRAAKRVLPLFLPLELVPRMVILPASEDPDSYAAKAGLEALRQLIDGAPTLFEWVIDATCAEVGVDTAGGVGAMQLLRPLFLALHDPIQEARYTDRLAQRFRVEPGVIRRALAGERAATTTLTAPAVVVSVPVDEGRDRIERACLEFAVSQPDGLVALTDMLTPDDFHSVPCRRLAERCWAMTAEGESVTLEGLLDREDLTTEERSLLTALAFGHDKYAHVESFTAEARTLSIAIKRVKWQERQDRLNMAIAEAERAGAWDRVETLMAEKAALERERHHAANEHVT